ncbi:MAG: VCBS repeat-containing protein [Verrucomicrobia bacterium]|nr:VCBS repeat-containing protein [Verrucomicrobiota bacterium]
MPVGSTILLFLLAVSAALADAPSSGPAGVRVVPLAVPAQGRAGFTLLSPADTGLAFTNQLLPEPEARNHNLLNGSGLAVGDYDGDGWCDVFLCNLNGSSALFRNLGGWKFTNVTVAAGLANTNQLARGAVFADVDGDGDLDLLVTYSGTGARLFLN